MMRLTFLMLLGNAIFYLIQAVSCCRILTRRFSWPVMVLGFAVGYLLFVLPAIPFPETGMIRGMIALVSFPLVDRCCSGINGTGVCSAAWRRC